ncbi:MAG: hypothetical protein H6745_06180 [Deltaproteobacteria bacterium]|nr:hypothetical protein [Deltaproteobacteria bacterium]
MNTRLTIALSAVLLSLLTACGKKAETPPPATTPPPAETTAAPEPEPAPEADTAAPAPAAEADTAEPAAPEADTVEAAAPSVDAGIAATPPSGLGEVPDRFATAFAGFFAQGGPDRSYKVLEVSIVSNGAKVFVEERVGKGAECRVGWAWLDTIDKEGENAGVTDVEATRFGGDCCTDEPCGRTIPGAFLHFLGALHDKAWLEVAKFVPGDATVELTINTPEDSSKAKYGHADVEAGKFEAPGCFGTEMMPSCDDAAGDDGGFTCRCDAGGYHVTYTFKAGEGENALPVLVSIVDDEH